MISMVTFGPYPRTVSTAFSTAELPFITISICFVDIYSVATVSNFEQETFVDLYKKIFSLIIALFSQL
jgi:hypothetical protein